MSSSSGPITSDRQSYLSLLTTHTNASTTPSNTAANPALPPRVRDRQPVSLLLVDPVLDANAYASSDPAVLFQYFTDMMGWIVDRELTQHEKDWVGKSPHAIFDALNTCPTIQAGRRIHGPSLTQAQLDRVNTACNEFLRTRIEQWEPLTQERQVLTLSEATHAWAATEARRLIQERLTDYAGADVAAERVGLTVAIELLAHLDSPNFAHTPLSIPSGTSLPDDLRAIATELITHLPAHVQTNAAAIAQFYRAGADNAAAARQLAETQETAFGHNPSPVALPALDKQSMARTWVDAQRRVCMRTMERLRCDSAPIATDAPSQTAALQPSLMAGLHIHIEACIGTAVEQHLLSTRETLATNSIETIMRDLHDNQTVKLFCAALAEENRAGFDRYSETVSTAELANLIEEYLRQCIYLNQSIALERDIASLTRMLEVLHGPTVAVALLRDVVRCDFNIKLFIEGHAPNAETLELARRVAGYYVYYRLRRAESYADPNPTDVYWQRLQISKIWVDAQRDTCLESLAALHPAPTAAAAAMHFYGEPEPMPLPEPASNPAAAVAPAAAPDPAERATTPAALAYRTLVLLQQRAAAVINERYIERGTYGSPDEQDEQHALTTQVVVTRAEMGVSGDAAFADAAADLLGEAFRQTREFDIPAEAFLNQASARELRRAKIAVHLLDGSHSFGVVARYEYVEGAGLRAPVAFVPFLPVLARLHAQEPLTVPMAFPADHAAPARSDVVHRPILARAWGDYDRYS